MKFRFCFAPWLGDGIFFGEPCETRKQAEEQLNAVANYTLFLHECSLIDDHTNVGWIEHEENGQWFEVDD